MRLPQTNHWALSLFSAPYQLGVRLRNWLYDNGWKSQFKAPLPIISVGNIVCGGVGKTPFIALLLEKFKGEKLAVLSRGYRSRLEHSGRVELVQNDWNADYCGDEPLMLARKFPEHQVIVGKDRKRGAIRAYELGAKMVLLDDGMQYRKLQRDIEITLLRASDLFGGDHFLPRGSLRDEKRRLRDADLLVITDVDDEEQFAKCKQAVEPYSKASVIGTRLETTLNLKGRRVGAFCAIGHPDSFLKLLHKCGAQVEAKWILGDHDPIDQDKLETFAQRCQKQNIEMLVCTEKDAAKIPSLRDQIISIQVVEIEMKVVYGHENFDQIIGNVYEAMA